MLREALAVSITAVYDKLAGLELEVSAALVRDSAQRLAPVIEALGGKAPVWLAGYRVLILDGNHLSGTEHRLEPLRRRRAAALPGQALVVLDPALMLIVDVLPWEDAYAQERSLLEQMLPKVQPRDLWIDDRNFCTTKFLFGIHRRQGCFLVRQHASTLHWEWLGQRRSRGRVPTGRVCEQTVRLDDPDTGESLLARRITVALDKPTRDGQKEVHLLTNLPVEAANAKQGATLYQERWTIERVFQDLTVALACEINTLGYPKAALSGFLPGPGGLQRGLAGPGGLAGSPWSQGASRSLVVLRVSAPGESLRGHDDCRARQALGHLPSPGRGRVRICAAGAGRAD